LSLAGVYLPVTTPFDDSGAVDYGAFRDNLNEWLNHPISGLVIAGSTGEAPLLTAEELFGLVESAAGLARGREVVVGTGAESTAAVIENTRRVADLGATAVLVRSPCYYLPAMLPGVLFDHFTVVADASPVPVLVYDIPKFVPVQMDAQLVGRLVEHPNIVGLKDSSGDLKRLAGFADACGPNGDVLVGAGSIFHGALNAGAVGGILGLGLIAARSCCDLFEAWHEDRTAEAGAIQERVGPVHRKIVGQLGIGGVKAAMDQLGLVGGRPRPPLRPLNEAGTEVVRAVLKAAGLGAAVAVQ